MARILVPTAIVLVALTLFALFDALLTPAGRHRGMPKWAWIPTVLLLPLAGPLLWLFLGRPVPLFSGRTAATAPRPASPDDDEEFLRTLRAQRAQTERARDLDRREAELRAREEELRRRRERGEDEATGEPDADADA